MTTRINTQGTLSKREESAFLLVAQGKTIKDAARCLGISRGVTYEHIEHGKAKLGAETTPHAISLLWERGHLRHITQLCLLLALWLPLRQTWLDSQNDEAIRITRTQRSGQQRRTRARGQRNRRDNHITLDPDTGQLIWPETQEDRLWT